MNATMQPANNNHKYKYTDLFIFDDDQPECIVGHIKRIADPAVEKRAPNAGQTETIISPGPLDW